MLSTLPQLPPTGHPPPASPPPALNRRGAQPRNLNAFRHGFYSARLPHPAASTLGHLKAAKRALGSPRTRLHAEIAARALGYSGRLLERTYADTLSLPTGDKAWRFQHSLFLQAVSLDISIKHRLFKLHQEATLLPTIAARAADLYNWEFSLKGIPPYQLPSYPSTRPSGPDSQASRAESRISSIESRQPPFVPQTLRKKSADSAPSVPSPWSSVAFLTDSQWLLLQPLLTTLRAHQARQRKYRIKPGWDDRVLLDTILWKLAAACRWEDLPSSSLIRACKLLYRQLCLSGRMASIYTLLHQNLNPSPNLLIGRRAGRGAERPIFQIVHNRITFTSPESRTWQHRTALLLLQRALFNYRAKKREQNLERRLRGRSLRLPAMRLKSMRPRSYHRQPTSLFPPSSFPLSSFPSPACHSERSEESPLLADIKPLESTLAYRHWRRLNRTERLLRTRWPSAHPIPPDT